MASLLFHKADKMKQRLHKSLALSCSSSASTSVQDRRHSTQFLTAPSMPNKINSGSSSTSTKPKRKKKTPTSTKSPVSSSRFLLLNSSRLQLDQPGSGDVVVTILDSLSPQLPAPPSFIDFLFPVTDPAPQIIAAESSSTLLDVATAAAKDDDDKQQQQLQEEEAVTASCRRRSKSCSRRSQHQEEVVLKVSLHCKGCASKVKKHISRMEGVTSFDIDIATKKVTVMGDVTPLGVLNCISKVNKTAQFWPSSSSSSSSSLTPRASASF